MSLHALAGEVEGSAGGAGLFVTDAGTLERIRELVGAGLASERVGPLRAGAGAVARAGAPHVVCGERAGWLLRGWLPLREGRPGMLAARAGVAVLVPVVG